MRHYLRAVLFIAQSLTFATTGNAANDATIAYSLSATQVSLHEPVLMNVLITNDGSSVAHIDLGQDRKEAIRLLIRLPDGSTQNARLPLHGGISRLGVVAIAPGKTYKQTVVLNEWYTFETPGEYTINVGLANTHEDTPNSWTQLSTLTVLPSDPERLTSVCKELVGRITSSSSYVDKADAALALSYVNDPIAVPYLHDAALQSSDGVAPIVIKGLGRIDGSRGISALVSLAGEQNTTVRSIARATLGQLMLRTKDASIREEIGRALGRAQ